MIQIVIPFPFTPAPPLPGTFTSYFINADPVNSTLGDISLAIEGDVPVILSTGETYATAVFTTPGTPDSGGSTHTITSTAVSPTIAGSDAEIYDTIQITVTALSASPYTIQTIEVLVTAGFIIYSAAAANLTMAAVPTTFTGKFAIAGAPLFASSPVLSFPISEPRTRRDATAILPNSTYLVNNKIVGILGNQDGSPNGIITGVSVNPNSGVVLESEMIWFKNALSTDQLVTNVVPPAPGGTEEVKGAIVGLIDRKSVV